MPAFGRGKPSIFCWGQHSSPEKQLVEKDVLKGSYARGKDNFYSRYKNNFNINPFIKSKPNTNPNPNTLYRNAIRTLIFSIRC